jgi:hypothetical protein
VTTFPRGPRADVEIPTTRRTSCSNTRRSCGQAGAHRRAERPDCSRTARLANGVQALRRTRRTRLRARRWSPCPQPNLPEYAVAFHGVLAAGGANTTINSLAAEEMSAHSWSPRARYLITIAPSWNGAAGRGGRRRNASSCSEPRASRGPSRSRRRWLRTQNRWAELVDGDRRCCAADVERR